MDKTKQLLFKKLKDKTISLDWKQLSQYTTMELANELKVSRNVISQYLNEFVESGEVVKVNERPVLFFVKNDLVKNSSYLNNFYESLADFKQAVAKASNISVAFTKMIGYQGSLSNIIQNCKSAITYPQNGLPILLLGPTGVGKSMIAQTMFEYGKEKGIFNEKSRFITVNCSEYADNPEFFLTNLFGCKKGAYTGADRDREGLISLADGGMLFLDEVHCLSNECQEKLFLFMDKGIYHMVGDNDKWYQAHEHLVFATTENPQLALLRTLYRRIPIVTHIPPLNERPIQEKRELLNFLLKRESIQISKEILITQRLNQILINYEYPENIGQMVNCIKACVANAFVMCHDSDIMLLDIQNLPDWLIEKCNNEGIFSLYNDTTTITLDELANTQLQELKLYAFNKDILTAYEEGLPFDIMYNRCKRRFSQYMDSICFGDNQQSSIKEQLYHGIIETICIKLGKKYNISFANNEIINIAKLYNDAIVNGGSCSPLLHQYLKLIDTFISDFTRNDPETVAMASDFFSQMKSLLHHDFDSLMFLDGILYLKVLSNKVQERETRCMILAHGYSTASSLATSVNYMMEDDVYDAIDMPMDVSISTIAKRVNEYIESQRNLRDLIILVDMGSLEDIHSRIIVEDCINLVLINNVTIKLALDVAIKVRQNMPVKRIMESIHHEDYLNKMIYIENRKKEKAILTVCATGIATAEKISNLLRDSFPRNIDCQVIEYAYSSLVQDGRKSAIFDRYDVPVIIGTMDPNVEGIPFISIEDMIEKQNVGLLQSALGHFLSSEELDKFSQNIIKNFSLQNLLDYLTILNPKKIVTYVEEIVDNIQKDFKMNMSGNTMVGLYLHISCLIERLITDKYITKYENIEQFEKEHQSFITVVKKAFKNLEKHYCVEIPVSEIAYIYDYIYHLSSVKKSKMSVEDTLFE